MGTGIMIASAQTLRKAKPITPFCERTIFEGFTFGLGPAGYDIRIAEDINIEPGGFYLASSLEEFRMPLNMLGVVHDKSTWARLGLCVQNTVIEPGWRGYLTLELTNHNPKPFTTLQPNQSIRIKKGTPICQVIFHMLDIPTDLPYKGKYQDQCAGVQQAILEGESK